KGSYKSDKSSESPRRNIKYNPYPPSKTRATNAMRSSSSKAWQTASPSLTAKAVHISPQAIPLETQIETTDQPKLPQVACYPELSKESANSSTSQLTTPPSQSKK